MTQGKEAWEWEMWVCGKCEYATVANGGPGHFCTGSDNSGKSCERVRVVPVGERERERAEAAEARVQELRQTVEEAIAEGRGLEFFHSDDLQPVVDLFGERDELREVLARVRSAIQRRLLADEATDKPFDSDLEAARIAIHNTLYGEGK